MYNLVILDDVLEAALSARAAVESSPLARSFNIIAVNSADRLRALLSQGFHCDVLVADIALGGTENGIQLVKEMFDGQQNVQVIYLTGYVEYCTPVYETDHVYFLLKPIKQADFNKALARAVANLTQQSQNVLSVKSARTITRVPFRRITYLESKLRKIEIHTDDNVLSTYSTIPDIEAELPDTFIRTHMSFIVNLDRVTQLGSDCLVLDNGETVPISKRRKQEVREHFHRTL